MLASALLVGPDLAARTIVATPSALVQRLSAHAVLVTVLGYDTAGACTELAALCDAL